MSFPPISHTETVHCDGEQLWQHMLAKTEHPDKYVPGVSDVTILERRPDGHIIRRMKLPNGQYLLEDIYTTRDDAANTRTVHFDLVDHPIFKGSVTNVVDFNTKPPTLTYTLSWTARDESEEGRAKAAALRPTSMAAAVQKAKAIAEAHE